jgi:integrase
MDHSHKSAGDGLVSDSTSQTGSQQATLAGGFCASAPATRLASRAPIPLAPPSLPLRAGHLSMPEVIDLYMAHYAGRDTSRVYRLGWWKVRLRDSVLQDLTDDDVHAGLEALTEQRSRYFAGIDAAGQPIHRAKRKTLAPATINRYATALAAVITWTIKKRIAPKGYVHPCRSIEHRPENNEKTRFLTEEETARLLDECRASAWPRLYLLILMALTTGARKGELLGLRIRDLDLERCEAHVGRSKNGSAKVLPLVERVVEEARKHCNRSPESLLFASKRRADRPHAFEALFVAAVKNAGLKGVTFHTLRHTCASWLAMNGATLLEIADVLGHRQLQMTKRYSHLATAHKAALINRVLGDLQ